MSNFQDPAHVHRKVAVLGFREVGKSSLTNSFVNGSFSEFYDPTIESTLQKVIRFRRVNFYTDIVDTAGMDGGTSRLSQNASVGVHGYALVFSITSLHSFDMIREVNDTLLTFLRNPPDLPRVLVGSKKDLDASRQVSHTDANALAQLWGVPYIECSSKTGENVENVFHTLLKEIERDDGLLADRDTNPCVIL
eukprot:scaffold2470_cov114-Cylindrotheca_fusiformis.AAC.5